MFFSFAVAYPSAAEQLFGRLCNHVLSLGKCGTIYYHCR